MCNNVTSVQSSSLLSYYISISWPLFPVIYSRSTFNDNIVVSLYIRRCWWAADCKWRLTIRKPVCTLMISSFQKNNCFLSKETRELHFNKTNSNRTRYELCNNSCNNKVFLAFAPSMTNIWITKSLQDTKYPNYCRQFYISLVQYSILQ